MSSSLHMRLPLLPIEEKVLFPRTYLRLTITSDSGLQLLKDLVWDGQTGTKNNSSTSNGRRTTTAAALHLAVFTTRTVPSEKKSDSELYQIGSVAKLVQLTRMQGSNGLTILLQGVSRIQLVDRVQTTPYIIARVKKLVVPSTISASSMEARSDKLKALTQEYMELSKSGSAVLRKTASVINGISAESVGELADVVVSYMDIEVASKQKILETVNPTERCNLTIDLLEQAIEKAKLHKKIANDVQDKLEGSRKEFLLRQQLEAIKKELGEHDDDTPDANDVKLVEDRIKTLTLETKAEKVAMRELRRLKSMSSSQPEYSIIHNYLEFFTELPWNKQTQDSLVVRQVQKQLDADHYGLEKVKKRITEYIAVRSLKKDMKGPILCLLGPPGVGKTSLGKSIATATNRAFERIALGGVHDESEIRGHRKTYIGAMPGCILNAVRHAESRNPVILLDEVDKIGKDFRGDPSSALLEVLDPHQNHTFTDHYLNVPFDLSNVMFIATANSLSTIPGPLLDRMEVIEMSGYSVEQKMEIAKRYLFPRQIAENGLQPNAVKISDDALRFMIMSYTREAGVRSLERHVSAVCRYIAVTVVNEKDAKGAKGNEATMKSTVVDKKLIQTILGHEMVFNEVALRSSVPGVATGMSWSTMGGSILFVEASCTRTSPAHLMAATSPGVSFPRLQLTGKLGEVMKESAQLALSWLRANVHLIESPTNKSQTITLDGITDVHIHFPEGAISKDGPSAGGAIVCALLSVVSGIPVPVDIAMTGEMTLRGVILPVGGIREKVLAAIRAGIKRVILPRGNQHEADELKNEFVLAGKRNKKSSSDVQLLFVSDVKELIQLVFNMKVHDGSGLDHLETLGSGVGQSSAEDQLHFSKL